jgi:hypothetical protein
LDDPQALAESAPAPALGLGGDDGGAGHGGPVQPVAGGEHERERGQIEHSIISPCRGSIASYGNTTNENDAMDTRRRRSSGCRVERTSQEGDTITDSAETAILAMGDLWPTRSPRLASDSSP